MSAPLAAPLAAPLVALLVCSAAVYGDYGSSRTLRSIRTLVSDEVEEQGCLFEGRWLRAGADASAGCLRCACHRGALSCRRRACQQPPDPPPRHCHLLHRKGACCPELHCPDGVRLLEYSATSRTEDDSDLVTTTGSILHACVEGGSVFAAGSALISGTACEQCFCLGGRRRCVRPRCLPAPPACRARPPPGACCPTRYHCSHKEDDAHNCIVDGDIVPEGERVVSAESSHNCTQCFCLRGAVRCQALSCAPALHGCAPLTRPGECCPHQYHCEHALRVKSHLSILDNALTLTRNDDRSFHISKSSKLETTHKPSTNSATFSIPAITSSHNNTMTTIKVKRKTNDPHMLSSKDKIDKVIVSTTTVTSSDTTEPELDSAKDAKDIESSTTMQPEGTVRIMINGTINCAAELSSTSVPFNFSANDTQKIMLEAQPRQPIIEADNIEAHTVSTVDIITDRNVNGGFDDSDTFTINVTSSLWTNKNQSTSKPSIATSPRVSDITTVTLESKNISKKTKDDYDYDYTEPTLPPSLPNLKIIPFVAADAVVDEETSSKDSSKYPTIDREDKFPIYYPNTDKKNTQFATRREDVYNPTQYPVFISGKDQSQNYAPFSAHEMEVADAEFDEYDVHGIVHESNKAENNEKEKEITKTSTSRTPAVNLFSPPVETEGGFVPKGQGGVIEEYFAVYPSTPPGPPVPHLTTSMQLDIPNDECIAGDGRRIPNGESVTLACSVCICHVPWNGVGELQCTSRHCPTPPGCHRKPAASSDADLCCGQLVCDKGNKTTTATPVETQKNYVTSNEAKNPEIDTVDSIKINHVNHNKSTKFTTTEPPQNSTEIKYDLNKTTIEEHTTEDTSKVISDNSSSPIMSSSTTKPVNIPTTLPTTTLQPAENSTQSQEYDEEEEEDEGFSFGSVLKLLLSESYDTSTRSPDKRISTTSTRAPTTSTTTRRVPPTYTTITRKPISIAPFRPISHHYNYTPSKKIPHQNTINKIDHLVLGEATAIKRVTNRPAASTLKPVTAYFRPIVTTQATTTRPVVTTNLEVTNAPPSSFTPVVNETPRPSGPVTNSPAVSPALSPAIGPGLLKLAGCNIYGRIYSVGKIIDELSNPCLECRCSELGVQCRKQPCH